MLRILLSYLGPWLFVLKFILRKFFLDYRYLQGGCKVFICQLHEPLFGYLFPDAKQQFDFHKSLKEFQHHYDVIEPF